MSFLDLALFIVIIIFLGFSRIRKDTRIFDRDTTASLRGMAMLGIIIHHIHNECGYHSPILSVVGYLATAVFFFISGYGNEKSLNKENVNKNWIINKFIKLYIPYIFCYVLYFVGLIIWYNDLVPNVKETIIDLFTLSLPNQVQWFPKVILCCFLIHWLCRIIFKHNKKIRSTVVLMSIVVYIITAKLVGMQSYWYNSVLCYGVGILIAELEPIIQKRKENINNKILWTSRISLVIILGIVFIISNKHLVLQLSVAVLLSLVCYFYTDVFTIKTKIFSWIGNNSFEFYLIHALCLQLFANFIDNSYLLYTISVIIGSFAIVYIYLKCKGIVEKKSIK